jgi:hypothetical protein
MMAPRLSATPFIPVPDAFRFINPSFAFDNYIGIPSGKGNTPEGIQGYQEREGKVGISIFLR